MSARESQPAVAPTCSVPRRSLRKKSRSVGIHAAHGSGIQSEPPARLQGTQLFAVLVAMNRLARCPHTLKRDICSLAKSCATTNNTPPKRALKQVRFDWTSNRSVESDVSRASMPRCQRWSSSREMRFLYLGCRAPRPTWRPHCSAVVQFPDGRSRFDLHPSVPSRAPSRGRAKQGSRGPVMANCSSCWCFPLEE